MQNEATTRRLRFGKFGLKENPVGRTTTDLLTIVSAYYCETRCQTMLKTRHFNGEDGPERAAGAILILNDDVSALADQGFFTSPD